MKYGFLTFLLILISQNGVSQGEGNVWFFGYGVFLDFNFEPPIIYTDGVLFSNEASSSLCNSNGELISYSNTNEIYNFQKKRINGWIPQGGTWPGAGQILQGSMIIPINDSTNFALAIIYDSSNYYSLFYTTINPTLDSGMGAVTQLPLKLDSNLSEKMIATRHANGRDWWVLTHRSISEEFVIIRIDQYGNFESKSINIGHCILPYFGVQAPMIFDEKGEIIASIYDIGKVELFRFDRCTGDISSFDSIINSDSSNLFYGIAFSPNSRFLYIADQNYSVMNKLRQYDLESLYFDSSGIVIWEQQYVQGILQSLGAMKLGPDGKVYVIHVGQNPLANVNLGIINDPNSIDSLCDFVPFSFSLAPSQSFLGLPNMPNYRLGPIYKQPAYAGPDLYICDEESISLGVPDTSGGRCIFWWSPVWGLDDPSLPQPTYTNLGKDTFFVLTVTDTSVQSQCNSTTDTVWVYHESPWSAPNAPDVEICKDGAALIGSATQAGYIYQWDPITGLANANASATIANTGMPQQYVLSITDTAMKSSCRTVYDTVLVDISPCYLPGVIAPGDPGFMQNLEITGIPPGTHLVVYDVTGRLVYRSYDYQNDWPNENQYVAAGLYNYLVEFAEDPFGPLEKIEMRKLLVRK